MTTLLTRQRLIFLVVALVGLVGYFAGRISQQELESFSALGNTGDNVTLSAAQPPSLESISNSIPTPVPTPVVAAPTCPPVKEQPPCQCPPAPAQGAAASAPGPANAPCRYSPEADRFEMKGVPAPFYLCLHPRSKDHVVSSFIRNDGRWKDCDRVSDQMKNVLNGTSRTTGVVVDVGTNIGSCTFLMAAQGHTVFSFEPNPDNVALVRSTQASQALPGEVILTEAGASDVRQSAALLFSSRHNSGNNVVVPAGVGTEGAAANVTVTSDPPASVRLVRLDDVVQRPVDVVKMDCQGCEVRALRGGRKLFTHYGVGVVVTEFAPSWLKATGVEPIEMLRLLDEYGYEIRNSGHGVIAPAEFEKFSNQWGEKYTDILAFRRAKAGH